MFEFRVIFVNYRQRVNDLKINIINIKLSYFLPILPDLNLKERLKVSKLTKFASEKLNEITINFFLFLKGLHPF